MNLEQAFSELFAWCRQRNFAGYDPFDALNSTLFQASPFKHSTTARLFWTQSLKRSPLNLRQIAGVRAEQNSKGLALFALAALANFRRTRSKEAEQDARELLRQLLLLRLDGWHGAAWGYNFDWQSRVFFAPRGTPTIVPTAFAARAFTEAAALFGHHSYADIASSVCEFILHDLPRSVDTESEVCFSYKPGSETRVFNASLLAAETLASNSSRPDLCELATKAARYGVNRQRPDGSWVYGAGVNQSWVDNFHTAFVLSSLKRIINNCAAAQTEAFEASLQRGYEYWRERFFLADGRAKYYDDSLYPIDAHAAATAIVTLLDFSNLDQQAKSLAEQIAAWSMRHLRDPQGFFYYQRRRFYTLRTPFMRWTQGWMSYALARLLEEQAKG